MMQGLLLAGLLDGTGLAPSAGDSPAPKPRPDLLIDFVWPQTQNWLVEIRE
jgi:hypothetical protein